MKLCFNAHFNTDGDFKFDEAEVQRKLDVNSSLYKTAEIEYDYKNYDEEIVISLIAYGDAYACRWCFRDLIESLICSIRTSKYWLVKDLYELLYYFHKDLWKDLNQRKGRGLYGNYDGTWLTLKLEEEL